MTIEDKLFCEYRDEGKRDSFDKLFKLIKPWLYKVIYRITCDSELTKDVIQETWITVLDNMYKFNPEKGRINNLIYTIAKNKALQLIKKYSNKKTNIMFGEKENIENQMPKDYLDPGEIIIIQERNIEIMKAVKKLSADYQDVIILHYFGELSIKEISDKLSKPEGTIKTNLARAREKLKNILSKTLLDKHLLYSEIALFFIILLNFFKTLIKA